jgi:hypothetical protein
MKVNMYFSTISIIVFSLLVPSSHGAGHDAIIADIGDLGGAGSAIGVDLNAPRDRTGRDPFQQNSTRFHVDAADTCGETIDGGDNDFEAGIAQIMQHNGTTLPEFSCVS